MRQQFLGAAWTARWYERATWTTKVTALLLFSLIIVGGAAAIIALGSLHSVALFGLSLGGGEAQGSAFSARTHGSFETGGAGARGAVFTANVGALPAASGQQLPFIAQARAFPHLIVNGSPVQLFISAAHATNVSANITLPDSSVREVMLLDEQNVSFNETSQPGHYSVAFVANSSEGVATADDYFDAAPETTFNLSVVDNSSQGINSSIVISYGGDNILSNGSEEGNFSLPVPAANASVEVTAYNGSFAIMFNGVDLTGQGLLGLDRHNSVPGFLVTYGVDNSLNFTNATVAASYAGLLYTNESYLHLYRCEQYDFLNRTCAGSWDDVTVTATRNTTAHRFEYVTTRFSGFSIKEVSPPAVQPSSGGGGGGATLPELGLTITKDCAQGTASFRVTGYQGSPVIATVTIKEKGGGFSAELMTDPSGAASTALGDGQYYLTLTKDGYDTQYAFFEMNCAPAPGGNSSVVPVNETLTPPMQEKPTPLPQQATNETTVTTTEQTSNTSENETTSTLQQPMPTEKPRRSGSLLAWLIPGLIIVLLSGFVLVFAARRSRQHKRPQQEPPQQVPVAPTTPPSASETLQTVSETPLPTERVKAQYAAGLEEHDHAAFMEAFLDFVHQPRAAMEESKEAPASVTHTASASPPREPSTVDQASYLRDLEEEHWFGLADGRKLKSLPDLIKALPDMANEVFAAHVTSDRNDFAAWISSSIGDTTLAQQLGPVKSRTEMLRILMSQVDAILQAAHRQQGEGGMDERLDHIEAALKLYESIGAGNGKVA